MFKNLNCLIGSTNSGNLAIFNVWNSTINLKYSAYALIDTIKKKKAYQLGPTYQLGKM